MLEGSNRGTAFVFCILIKHTMACKKKKNDFYLKVPLDIFFIFFDKGENFIS